MIVDVDLVVVKICGPAEPIGSLGLLLLGCVLTVSGSWLKHGQ